METATANKYHNPIFSDEENDRLNTKMTNLERNAVETEAEWHRRVDAETAVLIEQYNKQYTVDELRNMLRANGRDAKGNKLDLLERYAQVVARETFVDFRRKVNDLQDQLRHAKKMLRFSQNYQVVAAKEKMWDKMEYQLSSGQEFSSFDMASVGEIVFAESAQKCWFEALRLWVDADYMRPTQAIGDTGIRYATYQDHQRNSTGVGHRAHAAYAAEAVDKFIREATQFMSAR